MKKGLIVLHILFGLVSYTSRSAYACKQESSQNYISESSEADIWLSTIAYEEVSKTYPDGKYCAIIIYYIPNTGTRSTYELTVKVESSEVTVVYWPKVGWLDQSHFCCAELDNDGGTSFTSDKGYGFEVPVTSERGC